MRLLVDLLGGTEVGGVLEHGREAQVDLGRRRRETFSEREREPAAGQSGTGVEVAELGADAPLKP
jgi:hypothetical protein